MNRIVNSLLSLGLISSTLFSCQKELDAPAVDANSESVQTFSFTGEIDPVYDFDDEEFRAAKFTAEDAPRIMLETNDISGGTTDAGKQGLHTARTLDKTTVRVNWLVLDTQNPGSGLQPADGINTFDGQLLQKTNQRQDVTLISKGYGYQIDMKIRLLNYWEKSPFISSRYVWYGNVFLGGFPGAPSSSSLGQVDERSVQYYSRVRSMKISGGEYTNTAPNHRIDELDGTNGTMARRHFPLIGRVIKLRTWNNTSDPAGSYTDDGQNGNTGQIVGSGFYLEPRGTIFTLTLENQTGESIRVTDIQVPYKGTRGEAFSFEGKFYASGLNPQISTVPTYRRFDGNGNSTRYSTQDVIDMYHSTNTFSFPVYNMSGDPGITMAEGAKSGRLMVWAYAHYPKDTSKPFTVRVRYEGANGAVESKYQTIAPPEGGFKEGKAYRFNFVIKPQ